MAAVMQEVMANRVQILPSIGSSAFLTALPVEKDYDEEDYYDEEDDELEWDDVEEYDEEGNRLAYIETDLTEKEIARLDACEKRYREHPEEFTDFNDILKKRGVTVNMENVAKIKYVYR